MKVVQALGSILLLAIIILVTESTAAEKLLAENLSVESESDSTAWWRSDPRLQGRFHPEYPDDVQVIVHDGGPRITDRRPEVVWVRVMRCDGEVFRGQVLNRPNQLEKVKQGDIIRFIVPKAGEYPILVREQYLKEREDWIIIPCNRCGLTELFDPPSELIKVVFPSVPTGGIIDMFTAFCGVCGGVQVLMRREAKLDPKPELR